MTTPYLGACEECGNDDPAEGFRLCSDCIERVGICLKCGGALVHPSDEVHDECLDEWRRDHERLPSHPWTIPPDPFLRGDP